LTVLLFYSDNGDGVDAQADTGFPGEFYANHVGINEIGPEGNNSASYTPTAGQPGFLGDEFAVSYTFISDSVPVPEPCHHAPSRFWTNRAGRIWEEEVL
jgi:hypothetical protein